MTLKIVLAQLNFTVGDLQGNAARLLSACHAAQQQQADLVVFPELALSGYPPEDLVLRSDFGEVVLTILQRLQTQCPTLGILVGFPWNTAQGCFNAAALLYQGKIQAHPIKQYLPNYKIFDEKRYFKEGTHTTVVEFKGYKIGILICEDLWHPQPAQAAREQGAQLLICINASPFSENKDKIRKQILRTRAEECQLTILYCNLLGGQDELIFDGGSMVMHPDGHCSHQAAFFKEDLLTIECKHNGQQLHFQPPSRVPSSPLLPRLPRLYAALCLAVHDYIHKNHFPHVYIGLSGGIDSALTLAIAVDTLGADKVTAVMMPTEFTATMSLEDAATLAKNLGVQYHVLSIQTIFETLKATLQPVLKKLPGVTSENLQARARGLLLMAFANQSGGLVLTTGNKSEMAVGYATLYGDMAGGFAVLRDVYKTLVYELAHYRNESGAVIPQRIITRAPSAELAPDQTDQDTLPPYEILDAILKAYIEEDQGVTEIVRAGFDEAVVKRVLKMVQRAEFKRRQGAIGPRITDRAFGRDWRFPITNHFGRSLAGAE